MLLNEHYKDDMVYITHVTRTLLYLLGIWPAYKRRSTSEKVWKYFLILISYALLFGVLIPGALFWLIEKRPRVRLQTIPLLLFGFTAIGKYSNLVFREKNIRRCLKHIEKDYMIVGSAEARNTMIESAKIGRRLVTLCAIFMYVSGLSFRLILPFAKGKIVTAQNITIKPLPCPGLCGLAAVFVMHACGQLKILMNLMRNLTEEQWQERQEVNKKLAKMVEHQIRIRSQHFSFLQSVENILQQACLIELSGCTALACLLGYFIIMEWEKSNSLAMSSYSVALVSIMINLFMFCYTGEQLTVQAEKVARTSCVLEWYRLPKKEARGIVLIIIMSNMLTKVTAGRIIELSLKTYGDIIKTTVTYFNMLVKVTK